MAKKNFSVLDRQYRMFLKVEISNDMFLNVDSRKVLENLSDEELKDLIMQIKITLSDREENDKEPAF